VTRLISHQARARTLLALASLVFAILAACSSGPLPFQGTAMTESPQATPFELQDQFSQQVSLADFQGKVVLLTFLYTHCTDVCPITANQLRIAYDLLGQDTQDMALVAITVDPRRDDVAAVREFSERWEMTERWSYLVGSEEELRPIWDAYYVASAPISNTHQQEPAAAPLPGGGVDAFIQESYKVIHSAPIYVIDQRGQMRVVFTLPFKTEDLVHDVRLLLG
jgi:protein SCO1/2